MFDRTHPQTAGSPLQRLAMQHFAEARRQLHCQRSNQLHVLIGGLLDSTVLHHGLDGSSKFFCTGLPGMGASNAEDGLQRLTAVPCLGRRMQKVDCILTHPHVAT